jgi:hypothetical protein
VHCLSATAADAGASTDANCCTDALSHSCTVHCLSATAADTGAIHIADRHATVHHTTTVTDAATDAATNSVSATTATGTDTSTHSGAGRSNSGLSMRHQISAAVLSRAVAA